MKQRTAVVLLLALGLTGSRASFLSAQSEQVKKQIPEAPPTLEVMAQFLEGYAKKQTADQGGWMLVEDPESEQTLKLRLEKVHRDGVAKTGDKAYFVCADFKTPEGKRYDLDFWVDGDGEKLMVSDMTIHKVDGVPRYLWVESEGLWKRISV